MEGSAELLENLGKAKEVKEMTPKGEWDPDVGSSGDFFESQRERILPYERRGE